MRGLNELSASAIDQYERCPLAYKLSRDWRIPEEPAARMQFGAAMHLAIKAYFDGVRAGRPPEEEKVIACFLDEFSKTKIEEDVQRELYEKAGTRAAYALPAFRPGEAGRRNPPDRSAAFLSRSVKPRSGPRSTASIETAATAKS